MQSWYDVLVTISTLLFILNIRKVSRADWVPIHKRLALLSETYPCHANLNDAKKASIVALAFAVVGYK